MEIKNWAVITTDENPFRAPETKTPHINGEVYGHPTFPVGANITTSGIQDVIDNGDHKVVVTRNSKYIVRKETVNAEYERQFPGAYDRLNMSK